MLRMWWARWSIWIVGCALATAVVVGNAFYQKKQFYPSVVFITKSKPSMAVIYAQALLLVVMLGKLFRKLFFGQLRAAEFEHLVERSWYAVTETCLAFTVFRDDFSAKFLALFTLLLFLKSFHWLTEERVDYMERSPVITWVFHLRVLSLLSILLFLDLYFVNVAYQSTLVKGASVQLVFGFEYAILTTIVLNTFAKYVFHVIDMQNETPWENKAVFVLHTEVVIGLVKAVLYIMFVIIMVRIYTLPLFALRPTYLALRAFKKAVSDVIMSRRAINNMNNLYPDVTQEELANADNVCIICREEMVAGNGAKKLPCNHIFHVTCLRSWFQRQQTCPTCRLNVLRVAPSQPTAQAQPAAAAPQPQAGPPPNLFGGFANNQFRPGGIPPAAAFFPQQAWFQQQNQNQVPQPQAGQDGYVPPQAQQQGQAQPGEGATPTATGPAPATGFRFPFPNGAGTAEGFIPNGFPFGMPPMPYIPLVPPPPPLLQTTGLSHEELVRMEGNARENIEARLRALRNVQILLDSAVVQMQQYHAIVTNLNNNRHESNTTTSNPNGVPDHPTEIKTEPTPGPSTSSVSDPGPSPKDVPSASASAPSSEETSPNATGDASSASSVEQDELRKRRLQRFGNATAGE